MEKELQNLVKSYNNNQMEKEIFYKDQVRSRKESIVKENLEKQKQTSNQDPETKPEENKIIDNLMDNDSHQNLKTDFSNYKNEIKEI